MFTESFFDSNGVSLHYIDWGGRGRPVVLLAGLGGTAHVFRGLAPRLAERFRVVGLTRRGHGRSDRPDSGYDVATAVEDIRRFLDLFGIERATLIGHSWAGIEMPLFATTHPNTVEAIVYLDALHVLLEPDVDASRDPVWKVLETQPRPDDLVSSEAYIAYVKRSRPDLAGIWCDAIEADRLEDLPRLRSDYARPLRDRHSYKVTQQMHEGLGPHRLPAYGDVKAASLAFVLGGTTHPFLPPDASEDLETAANKYYVENFVPRIRRRTALFRDAVPDARIIELATSNHTIFVAKEDETVTGILEFLSD